MVVYFNVETELWHTRGLGTQEAPVLVLKSPPKYSSVYECHIQVGNGRRNGLYRTHHIVAYSKTDTSTRGVHDCKRPSEFNQTSSPLQNKRATHAQYEGGTEATHEPEHLRSGSPSADTKRC